MANVASQMLSSFRCEVNVRDETAHFYLGPSLRHFLTLRPRCGRTSKGGQQMKRFYLVATTLLLSVWIYAQNTSPAAQQLNAVQTGSQGTGADRGGDTIEGCLAGSSGNFTLTDSSGKTYQLAGDTAKLTEHVGHTVRISGSEKSAGADGPAAGGSSAGATFTVQKVKMVSPNC